MVRQGSLLISLLVVSFVVALIGLVTTPNGEKLSTLVTVDDKPGSNSDEGHSRVNPLQLLNVIRGQITAPKSLMFVETLVNGVWVKAMVDSSLPITLWPLENKRDWVSTWRKTPVRSKL